MKPMLAAATNGSGLTFPLFASPKLDGVRALVVNGKVVSRSLKPIPNREVQKLFGKRKYNGLDGELIVGDPTASNCFQSTSSGVMSIGGKPDVAFHIFDDHSLPDHPFETRLAQSIEKTRNNDLLMPVYHTIIRTEEDLFNAEEGFVKAGFEGIMLRDPKGLYKYGRSTLKQGWLLKLKRFADSEATVVGVKELMHNSNVVEINELGQKARSHKKAGMVGKRMLGALTVMDVNTGIEFDIGTGFTEAQRKELWGQDLTGCLVKYKYQPVGVKEKPRFPVFLGFRSGDDL